MVSPLPMPQPYESRLIEPIFSQRLHRLARRHTQGTTLAWEDAAQSAQIKILQAVRSGRFRQGGAMEFERWALTVARCEIIDLVRREKRRHCSSLDAVIPGTDSVLSETVADESDEPGNLERTDLVRCAIAAISDLNQRHPEQNYLALWQGQVQGKTQTQLAKELGLTQGEVSKRWRKLIGQLTSALGLVTTETVQQEVKRKRGRPRSTAQW